jgi:hypothetical protein
VLGPDVFGRNWSPPNPGIWGIWFSGTAGWENGEPVGGPPAEGNGEPVRFCGPISGVDIEDELLILLIRVGFST